MQPEYHQHIGKSYNVLHSVAYCMRCEMRSDTQCTIYDYSRREDLIDSGTMLCANAPKEWEDPQKLWNAVCHATRQAGERQAWTFEISLPDDEEMNDAQRLEIVKEYCKKLTDDGMCVSFGIHKPGQGNPNYHAHICGTTRAVDENGKFMAKSRKVYEYEKNEDGSFKLDEEGNKIKKLQRQKNGEPKRDKGGHIQYVCKKETVKNPWEDEKKWKELRKEWENIENNGLKKAHSPYTVSCETNAKQGKLTIANKHLKKKDWELMQNGGTNAAIERYKEIEAENARIREQYPEFFDKKTGKQIISLEESIKAYEETQSLLETKLATLSTVSKMETVTPAEPPIRVSSADTSAEKVTPPEEPTAKNGQISHEIAPEGYVTPPTAEEAPQTQPELKQEKQEEEKLNSYTVLHIHDVMSKITGYLNRTFDIVENFIKAKEKPKDRIEEIDQIEYKITDTYKYYESGKEAERALGKFNYEAIEYNRQIQEKHAEQLKEEIKATAQKAVSGIKEFAGGVADRFKEYRKKKADEKAYREWYEANKDKDEHGYYVEFWHNPETCERAVWISGEEYKKVVDEPSQAVIEKNLEKGEDGIYHGKKYFPNLEEAEKYIEDCYTNTEFIERNNIKFVNPPKELPRLVYPVDIRQERESESPYGYDPCDIPVEQDFEVSAGKPKIVKRAYSGLEPVADETERFTQLYKLNKEDCFRAVEEYKKDPEKCRKEFKDHPFKMTNYEYNCYHKRHTKDYNKVVTPLTNAGTIYGRITICKDENTGKLFGVKELSGSEWIKDYLLPDKVFDRMIKELDENTVAPGKWIEVKKIHVDQDTEEVSIDYNLKDMTRENEMQLKPEIAAREAVRVIREKREKAIEAEKKAQRHWHR